MPARRKTAARPRRKAARKPARKAAPKSVSLKTIGKQIRDAQKALKSLRKGFAKSAPEKAQAIDLHLAALDDLHASTQRACQPGWSLPAAAAPSPAPPLEPEPEA